MVFTVIMNTNTVIIILTPHRCWGLFLNSFNILETKKLEDKKEESWYCFDSHTWIPREGELFFFISHLYLF